MRIGIIGVGGIGGAYALALSEHHETFLVARGEHLERIQERGLEVDGAWGHKIIKSPAASVAQSDWDLDTVFLITKAHDALSALKTNAPVIDGLPIIMIQNGIDALDIAAKGTPQSSVADKIAVGISMVGGYHLEPGKVFVTDDNPTMFGSADTPNDTAYLAARLLEDRGGTTINNLLGYQWTKLIINTSNLIPAITGMSFANAVADPIILTALTAAMQETARIGLSLGIHYGEIKVFNHESISRLASAPIANAEKFIHDWAAKINQENYGSTAQSIQRGKPTETDYLSGAVIREAEQNGESAPVNQRLFDLLKTVQAKGEYLTANDLLGIVA